MDEIKTVMTQLPSHLIRIALLALIVASASGCTVAYPAMCAVFEAVDQTDDDDWSTSPHESQRNKNKSCYGLAISEGVKADVEAIQRGNERAARQRRAEEDKEEALKTFCDTEEIQVCSLADENCYCDEKDQAELGS